MRPMPHRVIGSNFKRPLIGGDEARPVISGDILFCVRRQIL
jgi:hypothetical protein